MSAILIYYLILNRQQSISTPMNKSRWWIEYYIPHKQCNTYVSTGVTVRQKEMSELMYSKEREQYEYTPIPSVAQQLLQYRTYARATKF